MSETTPGSEAWLQRQNDLLFEALDEIKREQVGTTVELAGVKNALVTQNGRIGKAEEAIKELKAGEQARVVSEAVAQAMAQGIEKGRAEGRTDAALVITHKQLVAVASGITGGLAAIAAIVRYVIEGGI